MELVVTTLREVAEHAKVSAMTVSRFLKTPERVSPKTRQAIRRSMKDLDYRPNEIVRTMISEKSFLIGVIVPEIDNPFYSRCFQSIEAHLRSCSFNMVVCNSEGNASQEINYVKLLLAKGVDGMILMPVGKAPARYLRERDVPFVLVDDIFPDVDADSITADHYHGARCAVEHLIELGHRKIGIVKGPDQFFSHAERFRAYCDILREHGIGSDERYVKEGRLSPAHSREQTSEMLRMDDRPTAVFSCNNLMSVGAIQAIQEMGLSIPDDISFVSFDPIPFQEIVRPAICCIKQPSQFIGKNAAMLLLDRINKSGPKERQKVVLRPEFVNGDSCAPPTR